MDKNKKSRSAFLWGMWTAAAIETVGAAVETFAGAGRSAVPFVIAASIMCFTMGQILWRGFARSPKRQHPDSSASPPQPRG